MSNSSSAVVKDVFPKLAPAIRAASGLASKDINFYTSLDQGISHASSQSSSNLLRLINSIVSSVESADTPEMEEKTMKESWNVVSDLLDTFLERSDLAIDEVRRGKSKETAQPSFTYLDDSNSVANNSSAPKRMEKPQTRFATAIDNSEAHPFKPLLTSKPHALVSLEDTIKLTEPLEKDPAHYPHPYGTEIMKQDYSPSILQIAKPMLYKDWESTEGIWVDTIDAMNEMIEELKGKSEIAVDLEHHDYRSYYGIVCLMQISTRDQDWLVDTLALREELHALNVIFTDPMVTKVFHGAFMDIIWLQRDLGLYVVSLFDTYHASKQLGFPKHSLAYLLERFAHFKTSKKYQLADWRIRPLTKPMRAYARSDTHFLLYIFDQLRNSLIESQKLDKVLFESRNVAVRRFEYTRFRPLSPQNNTYSPIEKDDPWKRLIYQYNISASRSKLVEELFKWRDQLARDEDESPRYIMPNQLLVSLASLAPTGAAGVLASSTIVTEHVRKNCKVIAELISSSLKDLEREEFQLYSDAIGESQSISEDVSFEQIQRLEAIFQEMASDIRQSEPLSSTSGLLNRDMLCLLEENCASGDPSAVFSAEVIRSVPHNLVERQKIIDDRLAAVKISLKLELMEDDKDSEKLTEEQIPMKAAQKVPEETEPRNLFDSADDIIVLKRKSKQQRKDLESRPTGEAFDYTSAPKVMVNTVPRRGDKKRPSGQFDPYSQESEGPRPAKKQNKMPQGKTSSFVSKKKK